MITRDNGRVGSIRLLGQPVVPPHFKA